jgi:hypothetical protein
MVLIRVLSSSFSPLLPLMILLSLIKAAVPASSLDGLQSIWQSTYPLGGSLPNLALTYCAMGASLPHPSLKSYVVSQFPTAWSFWCY